MDDFFRTKKKITVDVDLSFPTNTNLEESFISLLELHCVDGEKEAEEKDKNYFSSLESTGWLSSVGSAMKLASHVAEMVVTGKTVILKEGEGRSSSILISSLAQILLCEDFRTTLSAICQTKYQTSTQYFSSSLTVSTSSVFSS